MKDNEIEIGCEAGGCAPPIVIRGAGAPGMFDAEDRRTPTPHRENDIMPKMFVKEGCHQCENAICDECAPQSPLRQRAIEIARNAAKANPESYYAEPFQPHAWVVDAIESVLTEKAKLEQFKAYTHQRLDALGVPHTIEENEHTKAGCRVGGRFDHIAGKLLRLEERQNRVYAERAALVVAFAQAAIMLGWKAGRGIDAYAWDESWANVVYVDVPKLGQVSWHFSPRDVYLLDFLPQYEGKWDGTYLARDPNWCNVIQYARPTR